MEPEEQKDDAVNADTPVTDDASSAGDVPADDAAPETPAEETPAA